MSDVMLCGVLRMPPELWRTDDLSFMQVRGRMLEAATELEKRADEIERLRAATLHLIDSLTSGKDDPYEIALAITEARCRASPPAPPGAASPE